MSEPAVPLSEPLLDGNAHAYVEQCLASNYVSSVGPFVDRFEQEFAAFVGSKYAVACSSGTAAIHLALRVLDIGPGDEVFVSTLTFIASANPIRYQSATPVFVDSEAETWNLDPDLVVAEIERRARRGLPQPKAVEVVHILGQPARLEPIVEVCNRHRIAIVEDAAESLGAAYRTGPYAGRQVGTIGTIGCFSFNGNKIMTTGGGGMIVTDDPRLASRARHLTTQAKVPGIEYHHDDVGYNYRLSNLAAALGVAQLERLSGFLERRRQVARTYDAMLRDLPGVTLAPRPPWCDPSYWLYTIQVTSTRDPHVRERLLTALADQRIQARPIWSPLHLQPVYRTAPRLGSGQTAERLHGGGVSLPSSATLSSEAQRQVSEAVRSAMADPDRSCV